MDEGEDGAKKGYLAEIRNARHVFPVLSPCVREAVVCLIRVRVVLSRATSLSRAVKVVCSQHSHAAVLKPLWLSMPSCLHFLLGGRKQQLPLP